MIPPKRNTFIGDGDFEKIGFAFMKSLVNGANLCPDSKVLDVGSGQGRVARPLTDYLSSDGSYYGIEIVESAVDWCNREYRQYPNFEFLHADIYNTHYNKTGKLTANQYQFPFSDNSFDVIFFSSVFTHMRTSDVKHYLSETARCLKPKARCVITCFLLNKDSREAINQNNASLNFAYKVDEHCLTTTNTDPEDAIALDERYLLAAYEDVGLHVLSIRYGNWIPRSTSYGFQDMVIAEKRL